MKCEEPLDELTVQVWLLYDHPNFKYWDGITDRQTDGRTDDPITSLFYLNKAYKNSKLICKKLTKGTCTLNVNGIYVDGQPKLRPYSMLVPYSLFTLCWLCASKANQKVISRF